MNDQTDDGVPVYVRAFDHPELTHHHPQHVHESTTPCPVHTSAGANGDGPRRVICQQTSNINETTMFCRDECSSIGAWTQMKKSYQSMGTSFGMVWHNPGTPHLATGKPVSGMKDLKEQLHVASEEMGERLGMAVNYEPVDLSEKEALGVTEEGMDSTHDMAVKQGRKDSRGRFVF